MKLHFLVFSSPTHPVSLKTSTALLAHLFVLPCLRVTGQMLILLWESAGSRTIVKQINKLSFPSAITATYTNLVIFKMTTPLPRGTNIKQTRKDCDIPHNKSSLIIVYNF